MSQITLKQVYKVYGNTEVIHGVDLEVESGDFVVFVDPSGCGKPLELYNLPQNVFVAGFIGSPRMNLIEATFTTDTGKPGVLAGDNRIALSCTPGNLQIDGSRVHRFA